MRDMSTYLRHTDVVSDPATMMTGESDSRSVLLNFLFCSQLLPATRGLTEWRKNTDFPVSS
jgi:hypothetical protein